MISPPVSPPVSPRAALARYLEAHVAAAAAPSLREVVASFAPELERYAELIAGPGRSVLGFMTRGEGPAFTERVAAAMRRFELPAAALEHHARLASWFEHTRGFAKFEWHDDGDGALAPMIAVYFRRRPAVETALAKLHSFGVAPAVQDELRRFGYALEKTSIHFVSAAFQRGTPVQHKVYFSQLVLEERKPAIEDRLGRVFDRTGLSAERERWLPLHRRALEAARETTLYVSFNFTDEHLVQTFKIDYPTLSPGQVAAWAEPAQRELVETEAAETARAMGGDRLAYLGVRFGGGGPPRLKYYADLHGEEDAA
jgi:hypothetical protein